ncbi:hypothetical protein A4X09_0g6346 [Tilletia walkeri]|uniref:GPI inositol-deacylase n=1 Tax=Tilletia walkeri TaxID=117179 RepID=A0A8X7T2G4_9BASI|nr:hypothetical protein A4X09_0g6346 [Tilletia walkeri]
MADASMRRGSPDEQQQQAEPAQDQDDGDKVVQKRSASFNSTSTSTSSTTRGGERPKLISSPSTPRISPPHMAPITIHANAPAIPSNILPRPPPQAHIASQHSPDSFDQKHSVGRNTKLPQSLNRPGSPALAKLCDGDSMGAGVGVGDVSVSDRSGLRDDGVLRRPESVIVHEDQQQRVEQGHTDDAAEGGHRRSGSDRQSVSRISPLRGGVGLGVLGLTSTTQPSTSTLRSFSSTSSSATSLAAAAFTVPHLSPSVELDDALAQAQDDGIPTDEIKPHAEVSQQQQDPTPSLSFWDSIFPVPALMMPLNNKRRSSTQTDSSVEISDKKEQVGRSQTLDTSASSSSTTSLFPSMPAWLTPLSRSPTASPNSNNANSSSSSKDNGNNNIAPTEGNPTFLDTITRLRSLLGISDNEAPEDWVRSHRAELDDVVRKAEREEALEMAKRRAEALKIRKGPLQTYEIDGVGVLGTLEGGNSPEGKASEGEPEEQILRMQEQWISPKLPVVFCHGLFGFDVLGPKSVPALTINYWRGIINILQSNGTEVLVTRVPMSASIADRASALKEQIEAHFEEGQEVNLIGHSMGGLDCRYLISKLGMGVGVEGEGPKGKVRVRSLTTIATPHRGSSFADYMLDSVIGSDRMPFLLGTLDRFGMPGGGAAFENLTQRSMNKFNDEVPDVDGVRYYSWGAAFNPGLFNEFRIPHGIVYAKEGANDGLVSVQSSMWGTYQGTLRGVSHLHLIGWVSAAQNVWRDLVGKRRVFEPGAFYLQICEDLAREGL